MVVGLVNEFADSWVSARICRLGRELTISRLPPSESLPPRTFLLARAYRLAATPLGFGLELRREPTASRESLPPRAYLCARAYSLESVVGARTDRLE